MFLIREKLYVHPVYHFLQINEEYHCFLYFEVTKKKKKYHFRGTIRQKFCKKLHKDLHSKSRLGALYGPLILRVTSPGALHSREWF
jgi:hypothetical protein